MNRSNKPLSYVFFEKKKETESVRVMLSCSALLAAIIGPDRSMYKTYVSFYFQIYAKFSFHTSRNRNLVQIVMQQRKAVCYVM